MYHQHACCSTGLSHQALPPCHRVSGSMSVPNTQTTLLLSLPSLQHVLLPSSWTQHLREENDQILLFLRLISTLPSQKRFISLGTDSRT